MVKAVVAVVVSGVVVAMVTVVVLIVEFTIVELSLEVVEMLLSSTQTVLSFTEIVLSLVKSMFRHEFTVLLDMEQLAEIGFGSMEVLFGVIDTLNGFFQSGKVGVVVGVVRRFLVHPSPTYGCSTSSLITSSWITGNWITGNGRSSLFLLLFVGL